MRYVIAGEDISLYEDRITKYKKYSILKVFNLSNNEYVEGSFKYNPKEYMFHIIIINDSGYKDMIPNYVFLSTEEIRKNSISNILNVL